MNGTVGFQIEATRIEANYKLSQNRDNEDYHNIISRLHERDDEMSHQVADAMKKQR
jgi:transcriptional regulator